MAQVALYGICLTERGPQAHMRNGRVFCGQTDQYPLPVMGASIDLNQRQPEAIGNNF
jgi:hypothetical protein